VTIFEKTLSIICEISKHNPLGIEIDELVRKIDSKNFLDSIRNCGFQISDSDNVQTVYEKLDGVIGGKKTALSRPINEHVILEKIQNTTDQTETLGLIFVLFLLCKYRYASFHEKELRINHAIEHDKFYNIFPETRYDEFSKIQATKFPEELLRFVIKRHHRVSVKKWFSNNTKAWLFTIDGNDVLYFNDQPDKEFKFKEYRDQKWKFVLEIMNDLGLVKKNDKNWEITKEGEEWIKKIQ
jgi:predicted nucleic acid-binding protein